MMKSGQLSELSDEQRNGVRARLRAASLSPSERVEVALIFAGVLWRRARWAIRRREFWEEVFVYANPIVLGGRGDA